MKKLTIVVLIILFMFMSAVAENGTKNEKSNKKEQVYGKNRITKTYILKYVSPYVVTRVFNPYLISWSYTEETDMLTVVMKRENRRIFEDLLKKIDVKKKDIVLTVYTVIASREKIKDFKPITNKRLVSVLEKLNEIMSFKSYKLDGSSMIRVKDGQKFAVLKISSKNNILALSISRISLNGNKKDKRNVGFILNLKGYEKKGNFVDKSGSLLIKTETSVKEGGYLVAGVSKIGKNGNSLILVISAKIGE